MARQLYPILVYFTKWFTYGYVIMILSKRITCVKQCSDIYLTIIINHVRKIQKKNQEHVRIVEKLPNSILFVSIL